MSNDDIDKAVKEAAEFEAADKKRKEGIEARNEADSMVFQTEKAINEVGDKLDANEKTSVEADLGALKDILAKTTAENMTEADVEEIKAAKEKLMTGAQALFTKMYEQAQAQGQPQGQPDMGAADAQASDSSDDNVVDGEYKEV